MFKEDVEDTPLMLEDGGQSTVDELKEVNVGSIEELRPTFISASLSGEEDGKYISLLTEYRDIFAWSYREMLALTQKWQSIISQSSKAINQLNRLNDAFDQSLSPKAKVNKLIEVGFIREVKYPTWITNIVPVRKKNG